MPNVTSSDPESFLTILKLDSRRVENEVLACSLFVKSYIARR